jgi:hypothetical protein
LAREHPYTKFLRCRASAIGFARSPQAKPRSLRSPSSTYLSKSRILPKFAERDEDDPYESDTDKSTTVVEVVNGDEDGDDDDGVDTDMLPTMLVYRSGQLVHNWVRVDWEAGPLGIDELLERCVDAYRIQLRKPNFVYCSYDIIQSLRIRGSLSVPLNDEDDLVFSAPDEGL